MLSFYDSSKCGTLFAPDVARAADEGAEFALANGIKPVNKQDPLVVLVNIDNQVDFTNPTIGKLFVPGSVEDMDRLAKFIFANVRTISRVISSLDTHFLYQPFFPHNWIAGSQPAKKQDGSFYMQGQHPNPFTIITLADVRNDTWLPTRMPNRAMEMLRLLEKEHKKQLCIWPFHCVFGTPGHALDPALMEAIVWHSAARKSQYVLVDKGKSPSSEHYGIWRAEVEFPDDPTTALQTDMMNQWIDADRIYFCGQARTHCVLETLNQTVDLLSKRNSDLLKKVYVLVDCMSNVPDLPGVPFSKWTDDRFDEFRKMGVQFVKSTDPIVL